MWQWFVRSWQLLLLWIISLTLLAATLAAVYAPLPTNVSAIDSAKLRQAALPLFGSGFVAVFIFTFQTTRARLSGDTRPCAVVVSFFWERSRPYWTSTENSGTFQRGTLRHRLA